MRRAMAFFTTTVWHQRLLIMAVVGLLGFWVNAVQAQPNLNTNFTADITVTQLDTPPRGLAQQYTWYEWYTGHLRRINVINPDNSVDVEVFQFLPGHPIISCNGTPVTIPLPGKNGIEYVYDVPRNKCVKRALPLHVSRFLPVPHSNTLGFWDFLAESTNAGTCKSRTGNNSGTLWTHQLPENSDYTEVSVCVAGDNATPYWVVWRGASPFCPAL